MKRFHKKLFLSIFILFIGISFLLPNNSFAAGENEFDLHSPKFQNILNQALREQNSPGSFTTNQGPIYRFTNLFNFMMGFVGIAAFFMITWGGIQYSASAGNPSMLQAAKDKIWGAIFGLILAGFSVVILQTINPDLVKFRLSTPTSKEQNATTDCVHTKIGCAQNSNPAKDDILGTEG